MATSEVATGTHEPISSQDILAVVTGVATRQTSRRVFGESVTDRALRNRVALSLPTGDEDAEIADAVATAPTETTPGLEKRLRTLTERFVRIAPNPTEDTPRFLDRVLSVLDTLLTLPCLSPAVAAPDPSALIGVQTQTVETAEGVRVVFQQLPTVEPSSASLRVIVDASALEAGNRYSAATLEIAEGRRW